MVSSKDAEPFHEGSGRLAILADQHPAVSQRSDQLVFASSLQLTCKSPYLFFPPDIHHPAGIVLETCARNMHEPSLVFCPFRQCVRNLQGEALSPTPQSAPTDRNRTIKQWSSRYLSNLLCANESRNKGNDSK